MQQEFLAHDALSLEVGLDWPGLPNMIANPLGAFGPWGWSGVTVDDDDHFVLAGTGTLVVAESDPMPLAARIPACDVRAALTLVEVPADTTVVVEVCFYDAAGAFLSSSASVTTSVAGTFDTGWVDVPSVVLIVLAATWTVRVSFTTGHTGDFEVTFTDVVATSEVPPGGGHSPMPALEPDYLQLLGPATSIATDRIPMDVATLTATLVFDPSGPIRLHPGGPLLPVVDPAVIHKGRPIRLRAAVTDGDPGELDYLFRGWVSDVSTVYDVTSGPFTVARTQLAAVDVISALAGTSRENGAYYLGDLIDLVLAGTGVPYDVDTSTTPPIPGPPAPIAVSSGATAVDQVIITRDTQLSYAWANKRGVLVLRPAASLPDVSSATFDEHAYNASGPVVGLDYADVVNSLTIAFRHIGDSGDTVEESYGPFEDLASIAANTRVPKTITIQGAATDWLPADPTDMVALEASALGQYAAAVLAANSTTRKRITEVTAAVNTRADLAAAGAAHHDLYELVTAVSAKAGLTQDSRITRVAHTITPGKWLVTYGLADLGRVARPQRITVFRPPRTV